MSVTLVSKEGEKFTVPSEIKNMSQLVFGILEDNGDEAAVEDIPLSQVSSKYLNVIIEYCTHYEF